MEVQALLKLKQHHMGLPIRLPTKVDSISPQLSRQSQIIIDPIYHISLCMGCQPCVTKQWRLQARRWNS